MSVFSRLSVGLLLLAALAGCGEQAPFKIGFIGGLSGRVADLGIAGRNGVMLAIEQQNRAGGIDGRQLQLEIRDDKQDTDTAIKGVTELIDQEVELIIGHMTSSMSGQTLPLVNKHQILMLSPTTTSTQFSGIDDHFIRVIQDTRNYGERNAQYRYQQQGIRRIAVAYDTRNAAYTESWLSSFKVAFERLGGEVILELPFYSSDKLHFSELAEQLVESRADAVQIISGAVDAAMLIQQLRKQAPELRLATSEWAATEKLIELGGAAVEGVVMAQFFNRQSQLPEYLTFKKAFSERFGYGPGFAELAGYDAAQVALRGLEQRQQDESLKQAILRIGRFAGAQGEIRIDQYGDAMRQTYITRIEQGRFQLAQ